jgi:hypothetical protein
MIKLRNNKGLTENFSDTTLAHILEEFPHVGGGRLDLSKIKRVLIIQLGDIEILSGAFRPCGHSKSQSPRNNSRCGEGWFGDLLKMVPAVDEVFEVNPSVAGFRSESLFICGYLRHSVRDGLIWLSTSVRVIAGFLPFCLVRKEEQP